MGHLERSAKCKLLSDKGTELLWKCPRGPVYLSGLLKDGVTCDQDIGWVRGDPSTGKLKQKMMTNNLPSKRPQHFHEEL